MLKKFRPCALFVALLLCCGNAKRVKTRTHSDKTLQQRDVLNATLQHAGGEQGFFCFQEKFTRPSDEEMQILREMMVPRDPRNLGKGHDVREKGDYQDLVLRSAWKISNSPILSKYEDFTTRMESSKNKGKMFTPSSLEHGSHSLGSNEYLLMHGVQSSRVKDVVCSGESDYLGDCGAFGCGIYLADASDKMDQYITSDPGAEKLRSMLGHADELVSDLDKVYIGIVMRTYLGHYAEVKKCGKDWTWKDPETGNSTTTQAEVTWKVRLNRLVGKDFAHDVKPPFDADSWVVLSHHHGGCNPYRYNEILVPKTAQAAPQYLVVYERSTQAPTVTPTTYAPSSSPSPAPTGVPTALPSLPL